MRPAFQGARAGHAEDWIGYICYQPSWALLPTPPINATVGNNVKGMRGIEITLRTAYLSSVHWLFSAPVGAFGALEDLDSGISTLGRLAQVSHVNGNELYFSYCSIGITR